MGIFRWGVAILLVAVLVLLAAQTDRYLGVRRNLAKDRQDIFHSSSVFHVATLLALSSEQSLLPAVRGFVDASEAEGAAIVYAGKVATNALESRQIPDADWQAFVLAQYPSREAYEAAAASPAYQRVRGAFAQSYALGMQRSALFNLSIPVFFLGLRGADLLQRHPARFPFVPAEQTSSKPEDAARRQRVVGGLLANTQYGKDAVVVVNFLKKGDAEEQTANSEYGLRMMSMLAEAGAGPMHMGRAVTLEGDAAFDEVVLVYYPGVDFMAEMLESEFFTEIVGGKQLGDTLSSPTVPLLPHL